MPFFFSSNDYDSQEEVHENYSVMIESEIRSASSVLDRYSSITGLILKSPELFTGELASSLYRYFDNIMSSFIGNGVRLELETGLQHIDEYPCFDGVIAKINAVGYILHAHYDIVSNFGKNDIELLENVMQKFGRAAGFLGDFERFVNNVVQAAGIQRLTNMNSLVELRRREAERGDTES